MKRSQNPSMNTLQELLQQVGNLIMRGIQHGHFDYQITGSSNANGRRNIVLKAGITHRYDMNISDLPSNLPPIATFYPSAQYEPSATLETSAEDAQGDLKEPYEKGNVTSCFERTL